jgi:glycosyltransferase involved in cell wall biosynthesis
MLAERLAAGGVPVTHVPVADGLQPGAIARLLGLGREVQPALVHCYNPRPMLYGGLAGAVTARPVIGTLSAFACLPPDRPYPFLPQPLQTRSRRNRLRNRVLGRLMRQLATVSRRAGEAFCRAHAIPQDKLRVIGYGVDIDEIERVPAADVDRLRAEVGTRPGEILVGSVGRLVEQKDYPTQLRALAIAARRVPIRMAVAGAGPLAGELAALARQLGVADRVCWLGERRDVTVFLRAIDAFVIASKFEPFGVAVLEAMAAGLPIVATDVNELSEILDGGRAGVLVPAERPEPLADALIAVASQPTLRARLGNHARTVARDRHSQTAAVTAYQRLYDDVVAEVAR